MSILPSDEAIPEEIGLRTAEAARNQALGRFGAALPAAGGLIGGVAGGIPGATIGGMAGGAGSLAIQKALDPESDPNYLREVAKAGVVQGGLQTLGTGITKTFLGAGKLAMQAALKADPRVAATALQEGITASPLGRMKIGRLISESAKKLDGLLAAATRRGTKINMVPLAREVYAELQPVAKGSTLPEAAVDKIDKMTMEFLKNHGGEVTPLAAQAIKKSSDAAIEKYYARLGTKRPLDPNKMPFSLQWHKAVADRVRGALETSVEGVAETNARTSSLLEVKGKIDPSDNILVKLALQTARPVGGATVGAMLPGDRNQNMALGALGGYAATSPMVLSQLGLLLNPGISSQLAQRVDRAIIPGLLQAGSGLVATSE